MQPDSSTPPAPPPYNPQSNRPQNQYDFIMKPPEQSKKSLFSFGSSKRNRIFIIAACAAVFLVLILGVIGLISRAGQADTEKLVSAAKQQNELIRIADIGIEKSRGQTAKNIAITTKLSMQSQQQAMLEAVRLERRKLGDKELSATQNKETDELLNTAEQNNRFDEAFIEWMEQSLADYQQTLREAQEGADSTKLREALDSQYNSAVTLVGVAAKIE